MLRTLTLPLLALASLGAAEFDLRLELGLASGDIDTDTSGTFGGAVNTSSSGSSDSGSHLALLGLARLRTDVNRRTHILAGLGLGSDRWSEDRSGGSETYRVAGARAHGGVAYAFGNGLEVEALGFAGLGRMTADTRIANASIDQSGTAFSYGVRVGLTYAIDQRVLLGGYAGFMWTQAELSGSGTALRDLGNGPNPTAYDLERDVDIIGPELGLTVGVRF